MVSRQKLNLAILLLLLFSFVGILINLHYLANNNQSISRLIKEIESLTGDIQIIQNQPNKYGEVAAALTTLREDLARYRPEQNDISPVLDSSSASYTELSMSLDQALATLEKQVPRVRLNPEWISVDAFEQPKASSKIIGKLDQDETYIIITQQTGWYQVRLKHGQDAWVQSQFIHEAN